MTAHKSTFRNILLASLVIIAAVIVLIRIFLVHPVHTADQAVNPEAEPRRIVSLAPNITEILFELGLGDKIIAVSNDCDWPPEALEKKKVGSFWQPSLEAVIACKPDLVITLWFKQQNAVAESLERLGYRVLTLRLEKLDELTPAIEKIGAATGRDNEAEQLVHSINAQLEQAKQRFNTPNRPRVLWVVQPEPLRVAAGDTFITQLLELAGARNAVSSTSIQYPGLSTEELLTCRADVIIQAAMNKETIEQQRQEAIEFWSKYKNLPAVRNNRIYVVDPDTILRLGPRIGQGLEQIGQIIHEPNMEVGAESGIVAGP
jgi:iron complex transport system substrate-binding protein